MGGVIAAIESGELKRRLVESNARRIEAIERGEQKVVGVNCFTASEPSPLTAGDGAIHVSSPEAEAEQIERLAGLARDTRRGAGRARARGFARGGQERGEHHAGVDRGGEGRRDDRRMGRGAARRIRRISRPDRRQPRAPASKPATSTRCAAKSSACR